MAMKTPSAMPGAHQLENPEERSTTDTCHERGPNQWTDVVQHVRSQTDDPAKDPAEHRPDRSTRPLDRADGRFQAGEGACDSHSLRLRSYAEGPMEKQ